MNRKMKVAIDVSPIKNNHRFRGIGFYTERLIDSLRLFGKDVLDVVLIDNEKIANDCDLVHYPYFDLFRPTLPFFKAKPTVVTIHDVIPLKFPGAYPPGVRGGINLVRQKISLFSVCSVICDSESSKKDIMHFFATPSNKIFPVYLAPTKNFHPLSKPLLLKIRKKYELPETFVLYVGDANYNKNLPRMIEACRLAKLFLVLVGKKFLDKTFDKSHPENRDLVLVQKSIATDCAIKALGFIGERDLAGIYNLATVYCQPSLAEGFGLPVAEAMACGTPVAVSDCSSLSEIVGTAGALFDPYNTKEMSACLVDIVESMSKREKLSKAGLEKVKAYTWQKTALATISVYEKSINY